MRTGEVAAEPGVNVLALAAGGPERCDAACSQRDCPLLQAIEGRA